VIDFRVLLLTLGILLAIVVLTTIAAVANKVHSSREDASRQHFLDRLRQDLLRARAGEPGIEQEAMRAIVAALSGPWAELAAEEVSQLELGIRLDVLRAVEEAGVATRYLREARSPWKWTRARAVRILGELKIPRSVPALLHALEDRDPDVRNVAARSLGRMRLQAAEEALIALLGRPDQSVSSRIAAICIEMGPRTVPLLIRSLRDGNPRARFWSARILGEIRDPRATRSLGDALLDREADVRSSAAWALGSISDGAATEMVAPLLRDPAWYVRAHAAAALGRIGDVSAVDGLAAALEDRSWWVRRNALDALVRLGGPSVPALQRALRSSDRFARDCAVEGLSTLGVPLRGAREGGAVA
jgi:HEAT repeat protein